MKKSILMVLLTFLCLSALAQNKKKVNSNPYKSLNSAYNDITNQSLLNAIRCMSMTGEQKKIFGFPTIDTTSAWLPSENFSRKYQVELQKYISSVISFGAAENALFNTGESPFQFVNYKSSLCFAQNDVYSSKMLNTLKLDADQRAVYIIKNIILPSLNNFESLTSISEIKYFVISVGYQIKDFSNDISSGKGESVSIIVSKDIVLKYINSEMSDQDVMKNAVFYNLNSNSVNIRLFNPTL
jgi:hypothetical protein